MSDEPLSAQDEAAILDRIVRDCAGALDCMQLLNEVKRLRRLVNGTCGCLLYMERE